MRNLLIILFALFLLSLLLLASSTKEGFASEGETNYVLNLVTQLKRTSMALANPALWRDRISMIGKSPTDLAREYIRTHKS